MSLRQREWAIYMRPYYMRGTTRIDYTGAPKASDSDVLTDRPRGVSVTLRGDAEGNDRADNGSWVMYYKTNSFKKLREIYKDLLEQDVNAKHLRVAEIVDVSMMITPIS